MLPLFCAGSLAAALHVRLESSTPAADAVISEAPPALRLRFSGRIEPRYTDVSLLAPDGGAVPLGSIEFTPGSDREFTAAMPPVGIPGVYTVRWRTAGADGHVLQGSYTFTLEGDTAALPPPTDAAADPVPAAPADHTHDHGHEHDHVEAPGGAALPVLARWLHFMALTLLLGAVAARLLLLPRLGAGGDAHTLIQRRTWRVTALAALLLAGAALLRLWVQSATLHGAARAWDSLLLSIMLTDTTWGRAWLIQAFFFALLGAGITAARPPRDRYALLLVVPAVIGLSAIPALQGHAAGAAGLAALAVVNDALHVLGVGAWIGLLALLLMVVLPALQRHATTPAEARVHAVERFSPIALTAAGVVALTGVVNTLMHLSAPAQLWETRYGAALLAKLAVLSLVAVAGFYNWRIVRPRLAEASYATRLRVSAGFELVLAGAVLLLTAILTGLPRP